MGARALSDSGSTMQIIDTHVHVIAKDNPQYPQIHVTRLAWVTTDAKDMEEIAARLDASGVAGAVLVQALAGHGYDNRYTLDSAARYNEGPGPQRYTPAGMIDPIAPGAADTVRDWVARGLRGVRIRPLDYAVDDPRTFAVWDACRELKVPMIMMGVRAPSHEAFARMLTRYPDIQVTADHACGVQVDDGPPFAKAASLFGLARFANFSVKFSTNLLHNCLKANLKPGDFLKRLVDAYGSERLMWGSNYPAVHEPDWSYASALEAARQAIAPFSKRDQENLMAGAALRLWPELAQARAG
jgi:predicted TIM-barrel fold metal-dependent hydrolase